MISRGYLFHRPLMTHGEREHIIVADAPVDIQRPNMQIGVPRGGLEKGIHRPFLDEPAQELLVFQPVEIKMLDDGLSSLQRKRHSSFLA